MIAHALVLPTDDPEERQRHDADVEAIAMDLARAHEEAAGRLGPMTYRGPLWLAARVLGTGLASTSARCVLPLRARPLDGGSRHRGQGPRGVRMRWR